ncbi:MAG: helix-turn-helix domain-containing protein [Sphingobacterium sp.]|jgi:AraC-like DNA-binding protein|nr:helix-turn-helix domain-containing protein [Sphingobacterium sp.]
MRVSHQIDPLKMIYFELECRPESYLKNEDRNSFFEIFCQYNNVGDPDSHVDIYLIPLYRMEELSNLNTGYLLAFKRDYLDEDDKEYALDVFNLFNMQGQYTHLIVKPRDADILAKVVNLIKEEYNNPEGTYLILKALIKVYLLNLIRLNQEYFLEQDVNQKRIYQFIVLLDQYYTEQRTTEFYAKEIGITAKRLNQILKIKMNRSISQLIHERLVLEAKRMLITSEKTIKEIAFELNFEDPAYFSRFFKKKTQVSPETFKLHHANFRK